MATDRTAASTFKEGIPNAGIKVVTIEVPATAVATDTVALTLASWGAVSLLGFTSYVHTTDLSVIVVEVATSAVSAGVATFTIPAGNDSKRRFIVVYLK
jgi:hypothetical protein